MSIQPEHLKILDGSEADAISLLLDERADDIFRCVAALRLKSATSEEAFRALLSIAQKSANSRDLDRRVGLALCLVAFAKKAVHLVDMNELNSYNAGNFKGTFFSHGRELGLGLNQERYDRLMREEWRKSL